MTQDEVLFFLDWPELLPIYDALLASLSHACGDYRCKVAKTQISFYNRHLFAMVSLPVRRKKNWPKEFLMVSFGLPYPKSASRVALCVEAYPGRWTHHVLVENAGQIDGELLSWLREAYDFAMEKR